MNRRKLLWKRIRLTFLFVAFIFCIMLITMTLLFALFHLLFSLGIFTDKKVDGLPFLLLFLVSVLTGTAIAVIFSNKPLNTLREVMAATDKIAEGDYSVRLHLDGPDEFQQLSDKFNHMAEELGSVEMLRSDFVNNFSHEFKTPIVSIRGFAKMLKRDDLTLEDRNEYLDIIIDESERLAGLSANVLDLSRLEQQVILTDKKQFNVSEQIRLIIAMMEGKWMEKEIDISLNCGEIFLSGNEGMLGQVWINLLDNAIKFSPDHGAVKIDISQTKEQTVITFSNQCEGIPPEKATHIFDKFYQGNLSHTVKGYGLGLAIAKRIVELHEGAIRLLCPGQDEVTFEVALPQKCKKQGNTA